MKQFQVSIETDTTSDEISQHDKLSEAQQWAEVYAKDKKRRAEYGELATICIYHEDSIVETYSFE